MEISCIQRWLPQATCWLWGRCFCSQSVMQVAPAQPDLEQNKSIKNKLDNSYLAFRRDAIRFISAGA